MSAPQLLLYEHDDGRYLVACAGNTIVAGDPAWHRAFPIQVDPALFAPAIGQPWPGLEGSLYAGIAPGEDGQPDGHIVLLADRPTGRLTWKDALAWAEGLGDGAHVPTRTESALLYTSLRDTFDRGWHWTSTQYSRGDAFSQYFVLGTQISDFKSAAGLARAVRRFSVQSFNPSVAASAPPERLTP